MAATPYPLTVLIALLEVRICRMPLVTSIAGGIAWTTDFLLRYDQIEQFLCLRGIERLQALVDRQRLILLASQQVGEP